MSTSAASTNSPLGMHHASGATLSNNTSTTDEV